MYTLMGLLHKWQRFSASSVVPRWASNPWVHVLACLNPAMRTFGNLDFVRNFSAFKVDREDHF